MNDEEIAARLGISVDELRAMRPAPEPEQPLPPGPPAEVIVTPTQPPSTPGITLDQAGQATMDAMLPAWGAARQFGQAIQAPTPELADANIAGTALRVGAGGVVGQALQQAQNPAQPEAPELTGAAADIGVPPDAVERLQPTRGLEDAPIGVQATGGGMYSVTVPVFDPATGATQQRVISGDGPGIIAQLNQMAGARLITGGTAAAGIRQLQEHAAPAAPRGGGVPMGQVTTSIQRQIRGQATPEALADAAQATELRQLAQGTVDEVNQLRFAARQQGLQDIGDLQAQQAQEAQRQAEERQQILTGRFQRFEETLNQVAQMRIDPTQFWGSSGGERFARGLTGALAVALSGLGQAVAGGENQALQVINQAIDRNIAAQRDNMANARAGAQMQGQALQQMRALFQDQQAAEAATRALHLQAAISRVQQLENGAQGEYAAALARLRGAMENERAALGAVAAQREVQAVARTQMSFRAPQSSLPSVAAMAMGQSPQRPAQAGAQQAPQQAPGGSLADRRQSRRRRAAGAVPQPARPAAGQPQAQGPAQPARPLTREDIQNAATAALENAPIQAPPGFRVVDEASVAREMANPESRRRVQSALTADASLREEFPRLVQLRRQFTETSVWDREARGRIAANIERTVDNLINTTIRPLWELGVLQDHDRDALMNYLGDATSLDLATRYVAGYDPTLQSIEAAFRPLVARSARMVRQFGFVSDSVGAQMQNRQTPTRRGEVPTDDDMMNNLQGAGAPTR